MKAPVINIIRINPQSRVINSMPIRRDIPVILQQMGCDNIVTTVLHSMLGHEILLVQSSRQALSGPAFKMEGVEGITRGISMVVGLEEKRATTPKLGVDWIIPRLTWISVLGEETPAV